MSKLARATTMSLAVVMLVVGCTTESPESPTGVVPDRSPGYLHWRDAPHDPPSDPEELLAAYGAAFVAGDFPRFAALHAPDFEYDADLFCQFQAQCEPFPWHRDVELRAIRNMMDPEYSGPWPPVQERRFSYILASVDVLPGGDLAVHAWLTYTGLWDQQSGFQAGFDATLILGESHDGSLVVRSLEENSTVRAVPTCWGAIKCEYLQ